MKYKVSRALEQAFNGLAPNINVSVSYDDSSDNVMVTARKEWYGVALVPKKDFVGLADDEAADLIMDAAKYAVKFACEAKPND